MYYPDILIVCCSISKCLACDWCKEHVPSDSVLSMCRWFLSWVLITCMVVGSHFPFLSDRCYLLLILTLLMLTCCIQCSLLPLHGVACFCMCHPGHSGHPGLVVQLSSCARHWQYHVRHLVRVHRRNCASTSTWVVITSTTFLWCYLFNIIIYPHPFPFLPFFVVLVFW